MTTPPSEITKLLEEWSQGDPEAVGKLMPLVLEDLRRTARRFMARERMDHTLQPTALINEVYLRMQGSRSVQWENRAQFFGFAAQLMRRILVEHARGRNRAKRGGQQVRISLDDMVRPPSREDPDLLGLDDALKGLASIDARQSRIVELRFFGGLTLEEVAEVEGISLSTVKREWTSARLWLYRELRRTETDVS